MKKHAVYGPLRTMDIFMINDVLKIIVFVTWFLSFLKKVSKYGIIIFIFLVTGICFPQYMYNLDEIADTYLLPEELNEISGMTMFSENSILCVQDEECIIFFYDLMKRKIIKKINLNIKGDYEGIARKDTTVFILESNGHIVRVNNINNRNYDFFTYTPGIYAKDNEGLCYDHNNNRLLISPKTKAGKSKKYKDTLIVYAFDVMDQSVKEQVLLSEIAFIEKFAESNDIRIPYKYKRNGKKKSIKFKSSGLAIHPFSENMYLISSVDSLLLIMDNKGTIAGLHYLDPVMFPQPEGITFLQNGDMLISNEARDKKATILRFKMGLKREK